MQNRALTATEKIQFREVLSESIGDAIPPAGHFDSLKNAPIEDESMQGLQWYRDRLVDEANALFSRWRNDVQELVESAVLWEPPA